MLGGHQGLDYCKTKQRHTYTNTWIIARMSTMRRILVVFMAGLAIGCFCQIITSSWSMKTSNYHSIAKLSVQLNQPPFSWLALSSLASHMLYRMVTSQFISTVWCSKPYKSYILWKPSGDDNDYKAKTNKKCFQYPKYAIFWKSRRFKDIKYGNNFLLNIFHQN